MLPQRAIRRDGKCETWRCWFIRRDEQQAGALGLLGLLARGDAAPVVCGAKLWAATRRRRKYRTLIHSD